MLGLRRYDYERISTENRRFRSNEVSLTHNFRYKGSSGRPPLTIILGVVRSSPTNHYSCQKTRMSDISCSVRMSAQVCLVLSQFTRFTDRRTDGQTERPWNTVRCNYMQSRGKNCQWLIYYRFIGDKTQAQCRDNVNCMTGTETVLMPLLRILSISAVNYAER